MIVLTDKQKAMGWEVSTRHEWLQSLPLSDAVVECAICKVKTKIGNFDIKKCHKHIERHPPQ